MGFEMIAKRKRWRVLIVIGTVLLFVELLFYCVLRGLTDVEYGEHLRSVPWLPKTASHISYYRSYSFTGYEFNISKRGFLGWAKQWGHARPIGKPVQIERYSSPLVADWLPNEPTGNASNAQLKTYERQLKLFDKQSEVKIRHGFVYKDDFGNGGGITVAYDSTRGRAYYASSPR